MTKEPTAYCVGNFNVTNEGLMAEYSKVAMPIVQKFGGKTISADRNPIRLEGEPESVLVIIEFPSMKAAEEFYHSAEYTAVVQKRIDATAGGFLILSKGLPTA